MNVQCICPIGIGNYLMCYPSFFALKKKRPEVSLHLVALRHGIGTLAQGDPLWDSIDAFDPDSMKTDVAQWCAIVMRMRRRHFDASLSFFPANTWQYNALPLLCGVSRRYAFRYVINRLSSMSFLCTDPVAVDPSLHDIFQNMRLAQAFLGVPLEPSPLVFPQQYGAEDKAWAQAYCAGKSPSAAKKRIAVHPGSSVEHGMDVKRWQPERFGRLGDEACRFCAADAYIVGSTDEADVKKATALSMKETAHVVEPVSIRKTAALLSECALCICNDSGIMHMAACMGVPTVGIFGPTDEKRNGPYGQKALVIRKPMKDFPLWTAATVGDRSVPPGIDPRASLNALTPQNAWDQLKPWLEKIITVS
jgi:ADP-heptose:LPS heptosyltransferase